MSAEPAADPRQGRPLDCSAPSFSSHHEAAGTDLEEKREPRAASSARRVMGDGMSLQSELDSSRDREADVQPARRELVFMPRTGRCVAWPKDLSRAAGASSCDVTPRNYLGSF